MSSLTKTPSYDDISDEESGWTTYFEDFFNNNNNNNNNIIHKSSFSLSPVASSSSLLSDATSLVEKKVADIVEYHQEVKESASFKKRKNITHDDALEDTATSPLNSPKEKGNSSEQKELSFIGRDSDSTRGVKEFLCQW